MGIFSRVCIYNSIFKFSKFYINPQPQDKCRVYASLYMKNKEKNTMKKNANSEKEEVKETMDDLIKQLEKSRGSKVISLFYPSPSTITRDTVSDVYDLLKSEIKEPVDKLDIIMDSSGGDIDASFHIVKILRRFIKPEGELTFIIPRYAKSAATLIACGGDKICMGPTSEIGPLDPQITRISIENGIPVAKESFSPLAISSTIDFLKELIKTGIEEGAEENMVLAGMLVDKLLPLSLGQYLKSLDIGKAYTKKLLSTKMFKGSDEEKIEEISEKLVRGYSHHGYCIDLDEVRDIGLVVEEPDAKEWEVIWKIYKCYKKMAEKITRLEGETNEKEDAV